ncbi:MAG: methyltransferase [Chitinophagaceae bacterium]|nr:methyltransferase [Chitinophagaceae bacterium]
MLSKTIIKYIQSLAHKKLRDEEGLFIAEGPKVVPELLHSNTFQCKIICGLQIWMDENKILLNNIPAEDKIAISEIELEKISLLQTPNKVLAVFYKKEDKSPSLNNNISLMLDDIQDPGNMGTIIRTADWFGIKNIICSNECVDCYNPKVVQASMGSLARVNIIYMGLEEFITANKNINIYAATLGGTSLSSFNKIKEGIILIGNESKGVKENLLNLAAEQITIPKQGEAESLNAAVACGIILSHIA